MKKLWGLKEGKPFDADYPDFFLGAYAKTATSRICTTQSSG